MIYRLMKRDFAWRIALFSGVLAVSSALATKPSSAIRIPIFVTPILFLAAMARPQQRATLFEAALPVPARDLFLARLLSLLPIVWLPLAVYALAASDWSVRALEWAALLALLILLPLATRADEFNGPAWVAPVEWAAGLAIGGAALYVLPPAVFLAFVTLAFAGVFVRTWNTLPPSFQCAPREAVASPQIAAGNATPAPAWWIFTRLALPWYIAIYVPLIAGQVLLDNALLAFSFAATLYSQIRTRMRWMQAMPVPPSTFLLFALVPAVLPMIVSAAFIGGRTGEVSLHSKNGAIEVRVPLELWRHAPGGAAPEVEAEWGEKWQPEAERFLGYPLYNPFSVGPQSSNRFLVWQHDRAEDAIRARSHSATRMRILYAEAVAALSLAAMWLIELLYSFRLSRLSARTRGWVSLAVASAIFGVPLTLDLTSVVHSSGSTTFALLRGLLWRIALPDSLALTLALVPTVFFLWLLDRQIRESEGGAAAFAKSRA